VGSVQEVSRRSGTVRLQQKSRRSSKELKTPIFCPRNSLSFIIMEMIRLFLAVPVPKKIKEELAREQEKVKNSLSDWKINWVAPENFHITLIFLGWVENEKVKTLKGDIAGAQKNLPDFEISTGSLTFEERPIWLEIKKGTEKLQKLQEILGKELSIKGSYLEKRASHPHLTIGRVKNKGKSKLPKIKKSFTWKADKIVLYQSKLRRSGSVYTELVSFPLGKTDNF